MRLDRLLIHTCNKRSRTSRNVKGDPSNNGPLVPFKARVEKQTALVDDGTGQAVTASHVMLTSTLILPEDMVWFPSIGGEPADNVDNLRGGRTVKGISTTMNRLGTQQIWQVYF